MTAAVSLPPLTRPKRFMASSMPLWMAARLSIPFRVAPARQLESSMRKKTSMGSGGQAPRTNTTGMGKGTEPGKPLRSLKSALADTLVGCSPTSKGSTV